MHGIRQDLHYATRQLARTPAFTLVAVLSVALGIGANTAIFGLVNAVLLRPLPYERPDRVVHLLGTSGGDLQVRHSWLSYPEIADIRSMSRALVHVSAGQPWTPVLYGLEEPVRVRAASVSASYFEVFGVAPALGRFFLPEEGELGDEPVVVMSHRMWRQDFGGDPSAVGHMLDLDGTRYVIVGIAASDFEDPYGQPLLWRSRPPDWDASALARDNHSWRAIARISGGFAFEQAQAEQNRIWGYLAERYPEENAEDTVTLMSAAEYMMGPVRPALVVLLAAVGLVLLIACANVANLILIRTLVRNQEVALRTALGAGRGRIIRQLLVEVCLLFLLGGLLGLAVAWVAADALLALGGADLPRLSGSLIDGNVFGFALGLSLLTGAICGLVGAYPALGSDPASALRLGSRGATPGGEGRGLRDALVVAEIALSLMLLIGGGLLLKSLWKLRQVEPGFEPDGVITWRVTPRSGSYPEDEDVTRLYAGIVERLSALPGVASTGAINFLPMTGGQNCELVWPDDRPPPRPEEFVDYEGPGCVEVRVVSPGYFRALGIHIVEGRAFTEDDDQTGQMVAVISQSSARLGFPDGDAVGKRVTVYETRDWLPNVSRDVVGVVADVREIGLGAQPPLTIYVPHAQERDPGRRRSMALVVRTEGDPNDVAGPLRAALRRIDEGLFVGAIESMSAVVDRTVTESRFRAVLLLVFAAVALVLAAVGVGGVVGYSVSRRLPEIGVRMALGASRVEIFSTVMGRSVALSVLGLAVGLLGGLAASRVLAGLLYGVEVYDPGILLTASLLMLGIAILASWFPARAALRIDPVHVLRPE